MMSICFFLFLLFSKVIFANTTDLLLRVDQNLRISEGMMKSQVTMTVIRGKREKEYSFFLQRTDSKSAIVFLSPARDKGVKLLKDGSSIWMYFPSIEQSQRISGHMVRQGFMGSAVSYEDMMNFSAFLDNYKIVSETQSQFEGIDCVLFELQGTRRDMSYPNRNICVEPIQAVILWDRMFSMDQTLMKEMRFYEIQLITSQNKPESIKYVPQKVEIINHLEDSLFTKILYKDTEWKSVIDEQHFSLRWLEQ